MYDSDKLFRGAAYYYERYRPKYPSEFFEFLKDEGPLDGRQRVLDLGCGTGQLAIPISTHCAAVVAVDPDVAMLEEARSRAAVAGAANIHFVRGDSNHLHELDLDPLDLTIMGSSFHWMNRLGTLSELDLLIAPRGVVVLVSNRDREPPPWEEVITAIRTRWLGAERQAGNATFQHPAERHEDILRMSAFPNLKLASFDWEMLRDIDSVVGLQFSFSYSVPSLFGERRDEFERELRQSLAEISPSGKFEHKLRTEVIVARRTGE